MALFCNINMFTQLSLSVNNDCSCHTQTTWFDFRNLNTKIDELPFGETDAETEEESEQQSQMQTPNDSSIFSAFFRQWGGFVSDRTISAEQEVAMIFFFTSRKCNLLVYWHTEKTALAAEACPTQSDYTSDIGPNWKGI